MTILAVLLAFVGPMMVIVFSPVLTLLEKNEQFLGGAIDPALPLLISGLGIWLFFCALWFARAHRWIRWVCYLYLLLGPAWIAYRLMSELSEASSAAAFFGLLAAAIVAALALRSRPIDAALIPAAAFALAVSLVPLASGASFVWARQDAGQTSPAVAPKTAKPNIYHIVFDEFQSDFFAEGLSDERLRAFSDFTFYKEASTPYGRTEMALASMFNGEPLGANESPMAFIDAAFFDPRRSVLKMLEQAGYLTEGYLHRIYPGGDESPFRVTRFHKDGPSTSSDDAERIFFSLWAFDLLPQVLIDLTVPPELQSQLEEGVLLADDAPVLSYRTFTEFMENEPARSASGRYVFVHLILPHFPHVFDGDCKFERGQQTAAAAQHECATSTMENFVKMLKASGRFKDSLVVLQGDHGAGYGKIGGVLSRRPDGQDVFGEFFSYGRSRPLLLVKAPGVQSDAPLAISAAPATLMDVAPTLTQAASIEPGARFTGASLLNGDPPPREVRYYGFYNKSRELITDGEIVQYRIDPNRIAFDRVIKVPQETLDQVRASRMSNDGLAASSNAKRP